MWTCSKSCLISPLLEARSRESRRRFRPLRTLKEPRLQKLKDRKRRRRMPMLAPSPESTSFCANAMKKCSARKTRRMEKLTLAQKTRPS